MGYWVRTRYGNERYVNSKGELDSDFQLRGAVILRENVELVNGRLISTKDTIQEKSKKSVIKRTTRTKTKEEKEAKAKYDKDRYEKNKESILSNKRKQYRGLVKDYTYENHRNLFLAKKRADRARQIRFKNKHKQEKANNIAKKVKPNVKKPALHFKIGKEFRAIENAFKMSKSKAFITAKTGTGVRAEFNMVRDSGFFKNVEKISAQLESPAIVKAGSSIVYNYMVSDFVPYDTERDKMHKEIHKGTLLKRPLMEKFKSDASKGISTGRDTGKRGYKNTKAYQNFKKNIVENRIGEVAKDYAKGKYKGDFIKQRRFMDAFNDVAHTVYDVTIDENGVQWNRPNVEFIYRMNPNNNYNQKYRSRFFKGVRGSYWNERFITNKSARTKFDTIIRDLMEKTIKDKKQRDFFDLAEEKYLDY